ncbi:MAG: hypothetical protein EOO03_15540, partial [Chitinophagaceae bacterium]
MEKPFTTLMKVMLFFGVILFAGQAKAQTIIEYSAFDYVVNQQVGTHSVGQQQTFEAHDLIDVVTITAPAEFEVSLTDEFSGFSNSISFSPDVNGDIFYPPFWVRYSPSQTGGASGFVTLSTSGGADVQFLVEGNGIPASVDFTWTGAVSNDWSLPENWDPVRDAPSLSDKLTFDGSVTPTANVALTAIT